MKTNSLKSGKLLILGYGLEGQSAVKWLVKNRPDIKLYLADRNQNISVGNSFHKLFLGKNYLDAIHEFDQIFISPGIKITEKYLHTGVQIHSQTSLILTNFRDRVIGVTGTKGKTTVSFLIHYLLNSQGKHCLLMGNMGKPPFDQIDQIRPDTLLVMELSAHQLKYTRLSPHISLILNLFQEHLDHFESQQAYFQAKFNIARFQDAEDHLLVSGYDHEVMRLLNTQAIPSRLHTIWPLPEKPPNYNLFGTHNLLNLAFALKVCSLYGLKENQLLKKLGQFQPLPHRMEYLGACKGVGFYNDSIATVPEAALAAIEALHPVHTIIMGGFDRGVDFEILAGELKKRQPPLLLMTGPAGKRLFGMLKEQAYPGSIRLCDNLEHALEVSLERTPAGSKCLLSPAASSYDSFKNFEHRGDFMRTWLEKQQAAIKEQAPL